MKKFIYILILLVGYSSCQDVIELDIPSGEPRLVIDASFEFYLNENPVAIEGGIRLSLSAPFFDEDVTTVNDATVFITNLSDSSIINFLPVGNDGLYLPENTDITPNFDTDYELTVIYEGETYKATTQLIPTVPINNITQEINGDETEVNVFFTDAENREDYYLFDFDFNLYSVSEDRFYQGKEFDFPFFYENMDTDKEVTIKILGIDKQYFNHNSILIDQSEQGGNPFQSPPVKIRGNVLNTTNPDNYPLGYFNLSEAYRLQYTITK